MRWTRGGSGKRGRIAGLCCVFLLLAMLMPAARAEAERQDADVTLGYGCRLPSGLQQVTVRIRASFPARAKPSAVLDPTDAAVTVTLPGEVADEVIGPDATTVAGSARLGVLATQAGRPSGAEWAGLPIPSTATSKPLRITASGPVPSVTAGAQGDVVFSAGVLALRLDVRGSGDTSTTPVALECLPNLGQPTTLVTVPLVGDAAQSGPGADREPGTGTSGAAADGPRTTADDLCPPPPDPPEFNPKFEHLWPDLHGATLANEGGDHGCATVDGLSNVNKQKGAAPLRGLASVIAVKEQYVRIDLPPLPLFRYTQQRHVARTDLVPTEATFLTFGFMPTTAKMQITQLGAMNIAAERGDPTENVLVTTGWAEVSIRASDVRVNGTPLDVGPNCRTARPMTLVVAGREDAEVPYTLDFGGELTGTAEIPPFTGCGTGGDDLDRLLTASISGPGNFLRLLQGPLCKPTGGSTLTNPCPPEAYGVSITPGGDFRGTLAAPSTAVVRLGAGTAPVLTCNTSTITGNLRNGRQIPPQKLGEVSGLDFGCTVTGPATSPLLGERFSVEATGLPVTLNQRPNTGVIPPNGDFQMQFNVPTMRLESDACRLDIVPTGNQTAVTVSVTYNVINRQLQLTGITGGPRNPTTGCPGAGSVAVLSPFGTYTGIVQDIRFGGEQPPLP